jgi:hypothetical protein
MITLDKIQEMWERDAKMDPDNLHTESLNIPVLHSKYYEIYNNIYLLRKKAEQQRKNIRHERYEYFSGKAEPEVKKLEIRKLCKNIWMQMRNSQGFR